MNVSVVVIFATLVVAVVRGAIRVHPIPEAPASAATNHTIRLAQLKHIETLLNARRRDRADASAAASSDSESAPAATSKPTLRAVSQVDRDAKAATARVAASVNAHVARTNAARDALNEAQQELYADERADEALAQDTALHALLRKQLNQAKATVHQIHADASDAERAALERKLEHKFADVMHSVQSSRMPDAVDPAARLVAQHRHTASATSQSDTASASSNAESADADSFGVDVKARFAQIDKQTSAPPPVTDLSRTTPPTTVATSNAAAGTPQRELQSESDLRSKQNANFVKRQREKLKSEL